MGIMGALYTGISGMTANGISISVIGDNIANINTVGFKSSRTTFQNVLTQAVTGLGVMGISQIGQGVALQTIDRAFTQGSLITTENVTDLAITGRGFFVLYGTHQGITRFFYTRAGQLRVDRDGYLINPEGLRVQGYMADEEGNIISVLGDIQITALTALPNPTSKVQIDGNLNSESTPIPGGFGIDAADNGATDPTGTSNFSTSVYIYDSLGSKHRMDIYFTFLGDPNGDGYSDWQWAATVISEELQAPAGADEELTVVGLGYLNYDTDGALYDTVNPGGYPAAFDITGLQFEGASPQDISVDLGTSIQAGGTGLDGVMQFDDPFNVSFQQQDGYPLGTLQSFNIDTNGVIVGTYTNGVVRNLAQIALATFTAENGLMSAGGNLFIDTVISGPALVGGAGAGGRGNIQSSSLEQSNVDLAAEFVRMISAQRGFQANSRTITTVDALLQELLTLKR